MSNDGINIQHMQSAKCKVQNANAAADFPPTVVGACRVPHSYSYGNSAKP